MGSPVLFRGILRRMTDYEGEDRETGQDSVEQEQDPRHGIEPDEDPLLEEQEGKGYGEDEGEREKSLEP